MKFCVTLAEANGSGDEVSGEIETEADGNGDEDDVNVDDGNVGDDDGGSDEAADEDDDDCGGGEVIGEAVGDGGVGSLILSTILHVIGVLALTSNAFV
jgi:hypothetical protein